MVAEAIIKTTSVPLARLLTVNSTAAGTSIASPAPQAATPTSAIAMGLDGQFSSNGLLLLPYGVGSATTFLMSVFAWDYVQPKIAQNAGMWVAWPLATFVCTLGTVPGLSGLEVDNTNFFAGTITLGVGNANVSNEIVSPTGNFVASIVLDVKGAKLVQPVFAMNGSSTSANTLWKRI